MPVNLPDQVVRGLRDVALAPLGAAKALGRVPGRMRRRRRRPLTEEEGVDDDDEEEEEEEEEDVREEAGPPSLGPRRHSMLSGQDMDVVTTKPGTMVIRLRPGTDQGRAPGPSFSRRAPTMVFERRRVEQADVDAAVHEMQQMVAPTTAERDLEARSRRQQADRDDGGLLSPGGVPHGGEELGRLTPAVLSRLGTATAGAEKRSDEMQSSVLASMARVRSAETAQRMALPENAADTALYALQAQQRESGALSGSHTMLVG